MHWFWRAAIAFIVGSAPYVLVMLPTNLSGRGGLPFMLLELRRFFRNEWIALWVNIVFPPMFLALLVYGALTRYLALTRSHESETRCRKCGYILRGISEPRCPECRERI